MAATTLQMDGLELVAGEQGPAAAPVEGAGWPPEMGRARSGDLVLPIFDDDGVMIRVVLTEDEDAD